MTPVREDVVSSILGKSKTDLSTVHECEFFHVLWGVVDELPLDFLRGFLPLPALLSRCCGGSYVDAPSRLINQVLPNRFRADTPLFFCATLKDLAPWGASSHNESEYLVLTRKKEFYTLSVMWRECSTERGDGKPPEPHAHRGWYRVKTLRLSPAALSSVFDKNAAPIVEQTLKEFDNAVVKTAEAVNGQYERAVASRVFVDGCRRRLGFVK